MIIDVASALNALCPGCQYVIHGESYEDVVWLDENYTIPTKQEVLAEIGRIQTNFNNTEYQRQRAAEYPPVTDYLDAVVKGDQEQMQTYIDACLAVKAKYPKPE